jgi:hypothetical protein
MLCSRRGKGLEIRKGRRGNKGPGQRGDRLNGRRHGRENAARLTRSESRLQAPDGAGAKTDVGSHPPIKPIIASLQETDARFADRPEDSRSCLNDRVESERGGRRLTRPSDAIA